MQVWPYYDMKTVHCAINTLSGNAFHWITLSQLLCMIRISTFKKKDVFVHKPIFNDLVNAITLTLIKQVGCDVG